MSNDVDAFMMGMTPFQPGKCQYDQNIVERRWLLG